MSNDVTKIEDVQPVLSGLTLSAIQAEAIRAHLQHGRNSMLHPDQTNDRRNTILTEEVGEVAKEINEAAIRASRSGSNHPDSVLYLDRDKLVKELIQVAAMAATWIEALEGNHAR